MAGVGEKSWQLSLRADADLSSLRRRKNEVARALKDLETAGINHFDAHPGRRDRGEADLFGVRFPQVDDAWAFKPSERGPMVVLVGPGHVSSIGPELVTQVIENFASHPKREGDRRKLRRAATPQTHLFVWLEPHEFGAYESLVERASRRTCRPYRQRSLPSGSLLNVGMAELGRCSFVLLLRGRRFSRGVGLTSTERLPVST